MVIVSGENTSGKGEELKKRDGRLEFPSPASSSSFPNENRGKDGDGMQVPNEDHQIE